MKVYIIVTPYGPNKPFTYSLDGVHYQSSGQFSNLSSGMHTVYTKDATGKVEITVVPIIQFCTIGISYIAVDAACGASDGALTVTAVNGVPPYSYSIDGINFGTSNQFTGLAPGTYNIVVRDADGITNSSLATVYDRCPTLSVVATNETCAGADGTIRATPDKGTPPYQYSIDGIIFQNSPDFLGLSAGSYTVTIRDANGFTGGAAALIKNTCLLVTAQVVNAKCGSNNGSITALAYTGTPPYQYSIDGINYQSSNLFSGLKSGTYTLSAKDASGKTGNTLLTLADTPVPTVSASAGPASCSNSDGTLTLTGGSGTLPFTYSIDNKNFGASNVFKSLPSGTYTVFVKDGNGCLASGTVNLPMNCPMVTATTTDETCSEKNGMISASGSSGTPPYQYSLDGISFTASSDFSSLAAGTYLVTIKDALNITNTTSVVIENICPVASGSVKDGKCTEAGGIIQVEGSNGYPPYQYSIDGVNFQQTGVFSNLPSGDYVVTVRDSRALQSTTILTVHNYPSPELISSATNASCLNNDGAITIDKRGGQAPYTYSIDGVHFQATGVFNGLSKGSYWLVIKDANGCTATQSVDVALSDNLLLHLEEKAEVCEGSSVQLNVSSNASAFTWSPAGSISNISAQNPTVSPLVTTRYFVMATLGACNKKDSIDVEIYPAPIAIAERDTTICFGQSVALLGSGGIRYSWTPALFFR